MFSFLFSLLKGLNLVIKLVIDLLRFCIPLSYRTQQVVITTKMFSVQHLPPDLKADDKQSTVEEFTPPVSRDQTVSHQETDYSSVGSLFRKSWRRFASIWTRRFIMSLLAGQIVSLCITCTSVATEELTSRNWALPTTQTLFLCPLFLPPVNFLSDGCGQIPRSFRDLHALHDLPVYGSHSGYNAETVLMQSCRWF